MAKRLVWWGSLVLVLVVTYVLGWFVLLQIRAVVCGPRMPTSRLAAMPLAVFTMLWIWAQGVAEATHDRVSAVWPFALSSALGLGLASVAW